MNPVQEPWHIGHSYLYRRIYLYISVWVLVGLHKLLEQLKIICSSWQFFLSCSFPPWGPEDGVAVSSPSPVCELSHLPWVGSVTALYWWIPRSQSYPSQLWALEQRSVSDIAQKKLHTNWYEGTFVKICVCVCEHPPFRLTPINLYSLILFETCLGIRSLAPLAICGLAASSMRHLGDGQEIR